MPCRRWETPARNTSSPATTARRAPTGPIAGMRASIYATVRDWLGKPLDAITRRDIESRFQLLTKRHGHVPATTARQGGGYRLRPRYCRAGVRV